MPFVRLSFLFLQLFLWNLCVSSANKSPSLYCTLAYAIQIRSSLVSIKIIPVNLRFIHVKWVKYTVLKEQVAVPIIIQTCHALVLPGTILASFKTVLI